jgi:hypothetical protein
MTDPKSKILARRAKFLAAAAAASGIVACSSEDAKAPQPQPCLTPVADTGGDVSDTAVSDSSTEDTAPMPCLDVAADSGADAEDTMPMPCLAPPPADSGSDG